MPLIFLGLAGTGALIDALKDAQTNFPDCKEYIISRHCFSISTTEREVFVTHNQKIEGEELREMDYYNLLQSLRDSGIKIHSFTQVSAYGNDLVSRYSGVKVEESSTTFEAEICSDNPSEEMLRINDDLVESFTRAFEDSPCILDWFRSTHLRHGYYGCFLHDVKAYFVACRYFDLVKMNVLTERKLYMLGPKFYDYPIEDSVEICETVVSPKQNAMFSQFFNNWLVLGERNPVDYVVTDPGPGHKKRGKLSLVAQDVDDAITLFLTPSIYKLYISDETRVFSRSTFCIANFNEKFEHLEIYENDSVKGKMPDRILNRDVKKCQELLDSGEWDL